MSLSEATNNQELKAMPLNIGVEPEGEWTGILARSHTYISAQTGEGPYSPGQKIQFSLPLTMMDLRNHQFQFSLTGVAGAASTYNRFNNGIKSVIDRVTIQFGSKIIQDIQDYNVVSLCDDLDKHKDWENTVGQFAFGYGSNLQRNAWFSQNTKVYGIQLYNFHDQFLHSIIPCQKIPVQLVINIYLAAANKCIESDGTGATYTLNNAQFHFSNVVPTENWNSMYNSVIPQGITSTYSSYQCQEDSSTAQAGLSNFSKVLTFKLSDLTGLNIVFRPTAGLTLYATDNKLSNFVYTNINQAYVRIGSQSFPDNNSTNISDRLSMTCEYYSESMQDVPLKFATNFDSAELDVPGTFMLSFPLRKHPYEEGNEQRIIATGLNTSIATSIVLNVGFSVPLPVAYTMNIMAQYNATVRYNSNGSISYFD